jgi:hypothetical protein
MLDPVGPQTYRMPEKATGTLVVFSEFEVGPNPDPANEYHRHSNYDLLTADGSHLLQRVTNYRLPMIGDDPVSIELPPGSYLVKAFGSHHLVQVPVVIEANRTTDVHLDGDFRRDRTKSSAYDVYLPNGDVVGSRANSDQKPLASVVR